MKKVGIVYGCALLLSSITVSSCQKDSSQSGDVEVQGPSEPAQGGDSVAGGQSPSSDGPAFSEFKDQVLKECQDSLGLFASEIVYTGFDGTNEFQSPLWTSSSCKIEADIEAAEGRYTSAQMRELFEGIVEIRDLETLAEGKTFQVSFGTAGIFSWDEAASALEFGEYGAILEATAAGESDVTITLGELSTTVKVIAKEYQAADTNAGEQIYDGTTAVDGVTACASCHQSANGVDHSPNWVSVCSDAELASAITTGEYGNNDQDEEGMCTGYKLSVAHSWSLNADQANQVIAYLRTLPLQPEAANEEEEADADAEE
ncbi:c-type cytochrome [Pseudobacteriovorax antillogorgiicola]|uniref:Cytochrome c domain-containing protein n=1 Tax=Pseudobacteriovorax antillogorgiicola TaxID=1513793 RepID=A0A1Y6CCL1_9BACT|nr:hypothetical protein [Pseudobacteriovorax antillogorgiicola]TCS48280.1 hypothetical protein EDD56_11860 [Pseudobacteriovorax antillogorgiicola]SMF56989.1 hypothetical protein SAMN06296036_11881 [Pseudobacteriovorax antillogorgiicola]